MKKAFRNKAKQFHPDINPSPDAQNEFIQVHQAYEIVLSHLEGRFRGKVYDDLLSEVRKQYAKQQAYQYARKQYEKVKQETDAYHNSPYAWVFRILYYGLYYLYILCAMVFAFVPLWAGYEGGVFYLLICLPLYVLAWFTVKMAMQWKKEIEPLFN